MSNLKLKLERFHDTGHETLGRLYLNGQFRCFTIEDTYRPVKVKHETRIPAGTYEVRFRKFGSFHSRYSGRFPNLHKGMLELVNVPGYDGILIHIGNTNADTSGCLLVGTDYVLDQKTKRARVNNSTAAYIMLYQLVATHLSFAGHTATIEIIDNKR
jgi:hypothetical protein